MHTLTGHKGEVSSTQFNWSGQLIATGSIDRTARIWDVGSGRCLQVRQGHSDEVLDVAFDTTGRTLVTASADAEARVYDIKTGTCVHVLKGHEGEVSKAAFNPQGTKVITASSDKTCRLWDSATGECLQVLSGHTDEVFSCAFNYDGDYVITGAAGGRRGLPHLPSRARSVHGSLSRVLCCLERRGGPVFSDGCWRAPAFGGLRDREQGQHVQDLEGVRPGGLAQRELIGRPGAGWRRGPAAPAANAATHHRRQARFRVGLPGWERVAGSSLRFGREQQVTSGSTPAWWRGFAVKQRRRSPELVAARGRSSFGGASALQGRYRPTPTVSRWGGGPPPLQQRTSGDEALRLNRLKRNEEMKCVFSLPEHEMPPGSRDLHEYP